MVTDLPVGDVTVLHTGLDEVRCDGLPASSSDDGSNSLVALEASALTLGKCDGPCLVVDLCAEAEPLPLTFCPAVKASGKVDNKVWVL